MDKIKQATIKLEAFCKQQSYQGYSLYDSHNGFIPFEKFGKTISFLANQAIKRSPVNIRPIIGVKKGINPKGYGLFLHAYSLLAEMDVIDKNEAEEKAHFFFNWLKKNPSKGYSGHCWGYNYDWPHKNGDVFYKNTPSSVVTGFISRALFEYYKLCKNPEIKRIINSSANFILNDIILTETEFGLCFSYTPARRDLTVNASLLAAEVLVYDDYLHNKSEHKDVVKGVMDFTKHFQNKDGSWYYKHKLDSYDPKNQIDFHQGYVCETMHNIIKYGQGLYDDYLPCIKKGLNFYYANQFDEQGRGFWRLPAKWPIDIHNQCQGIITFAKFKDFEKDYLPFAKTIAQWTINNMQGKKGNFYYQKWPLITNKVNYLRWNQAWMLLALSTLLKENNQ